MLCRYFNTGSLLAHYGHVLAILLRLRQLCCHPALVAAAVALKEGISFIPSWIILTLFPDPNKQIDNIWRKINE